MDVSWLPADVLIIDDALESLSALSTLLIDNGYQVRAVTDAGQALRSIELKLPDLILLDVRLPDMSGLELCQRLQADARTAEVPIIFLSALADGSDRVRGLEVGGIDYLTKPFHAEEALLKLRQQIAFSRQQRALHEQNQRLREEIDSRKKLERELQQANEKLAKMANYDDLTGVPNRRRLNLRLAQEWSRLGRQGRPLSLLLCDIDHFKLYNDGYGHQAGDRCLTTVAGAISDELKRSSDFVARYGGEEFVIVLPDAALSQAAQIATAVCQKIRGLGLSHANAPSGIVTISIGVACDTPTVSENPEALLSKADQALYVAKSQGRDRIAVQSQSSGEAA